jgi:hypothetical protein
MITPEIVKAPSKILIAYDGSIPAARALQAKRSLVTAIILTAPPPLSFPVAPRK